MNKTLDQLQFDNRYARLGEPFHSRVKPTPFSNHHLISLNERALACLELDPTQLKAGDLIDKVVGLQEWPGTDPVAMCYSGHQFGNYVPQLGDGRAILLGEVVNDQGQRWDLHLKGAGPTPYSRQGDGRAVLRSTIREYLCSEVMHGLGIPSTRALCIIGTQDEVYREEIESGALLIRMAPSHVRFGSFEYFYYTNRFRHLQKLADHVIDTHLPHCRDQAHPVMALLEHAVKTTADLIAQWQAVGFCHGVMNSDNMSILGITLDYGPYGFLDSYDPGFICNHSDHHGRYAYDQQPQIGLFNLSCLAQALLPLLDEEPDQAVEMARQALAAYEPRLVKQFARLMRAKLGLHTEQQQDRDLSVDLLDAMAQNKVDYTLFFRRLCDFDATGDNAALRDLFLDRAAFDAWAQRYGQRVQRESLTREERRKKMLATNPKYVLRNYMAQKAIELAQQGDYSLIEDLLTVLQEPFAEHPACEQFAGQPPDWAQTIQVSCSS